MLILCYVVDLILSFVPLVLQHNYETVLFLQTAKSKEQQQHKN